MRYLGLIFILIGVFSCTPKEEGFVIKGELTGFQDSTMFYLKKSGQSNAIDSVMLIDNSFELRGKVDELGRYVLKAKEHWGFFSLWVDNLEITIKAKDLGFYNATITGGEWNENDPDLQKKLYPYNAKMDSLNASMGMNYERYKAVSSESSKIDAAQDKIIIDHYKKNCNRLGDVYDLYTFYRDDISKDTLQMIYKNMPEKLQMSKYGKALKYYANLKESVYEQGVFMDGTMQDQDLKDVKISDSLGTFTVLQFTTPSCGYCLREIDKYKETYQKHKKNGLRIISLYYNIDKNDFAKFIADHEITWTCLRDPGSTLSEYSIAHELKGFPITFIFNENKEIIHLEIGSDTINSIGLFLDSVITETKIN